jgi:hypothetical protein
MRPDRVEGILSAYGAERELRLVLEAYLRQSDMAEPADRSD